VLIFFIKLSQFETDNDTQIQGDDTFIHWMLKAEEEREEIEERDRERRGIYFEPWEKQAEDKGNDWIIKP